MTNWTSILLRKHLGRWSPAGHNPLDVRIWMLAGVVMLGAGMTLLDSTAVNVAFNTIHRELHAPIPVAQWTITGYLLTLATVVPVAGWAMDRFGTKRLWMFSLSVFMLGSALSGISWSIAALIAFRVLQGIGGGMIVPVAQTILTRAAGPARLGRVMSILGVITVLGPVLGPVLGGALVQDLSWHWIFYVNIPIGAVALATARLLPDGEFRRYAPLDVPGLAATSVGTAGLIFGLSRADGGRGFGEPLTYVPILVGGLFLAWFVLHSLRRGPAALIDIRLFANRNFSAASIFLFLATAVLVGGQLLLPLYNQVVRGTGAFEAGVLLAPQGIGVAVAMSLAGRITDRLGPRVIVLPGLGLALLGTAVYTQVSVHTPAVLLGAALVVRGLGIGCVMIPTSAAAYASLRTDHVARATSALTTIRQIGGSIGAASVAAILTHNLAHLAAASAFANTFWIAVAVTAVIAVPAMFLPNVAAGSRRNP